MDDDALIAHYLDQDALRSPGNACLRVGAILVWVLIRDLKLARGNVLQVAADYGLPRDAIVAARTYYFRHATLIDARIADETARSDAGRRVA